MNPFSRRFVRFNWWALVFIFLVVIAGSFVRTTVVVWVAPIGPSVLSSGSHRLIVAKYHKLQREVQSTKSEKVEKFCDIISVFGMSDVAEQLKMILTYSKKKILMFAKRGRSI